MVHEAVDHGCSHGDITEDLAPAPEGLVGGHDHAGSLVARTDELEEEVRGLGLEGDVADLVDDDERVAPEADELGLELSRGMGLGQAGDPLGRCGELDPVAGPAGPDAERDGQDASMSVKPSVGSPPVGGRDPAPRTA